MNKPNHHSKRARVAVIHGRTAVVIPQSPAHSETQLFCQLKGRQLKPVCGDWVELDEAGHIVALEPRQNEFPRVDARGKRRVVAANLDRVLIVVAPKPAPSPHLLDRYLLACHAVGVAAGIVINKVDLIDAGEPLENVNSAAYEALGYPVLCVSAKRNESLDQITQLIGNGTGILVGQSGVGKSTIANGLIPDLDSQTKELSSATGKGRHTTSTSSLYRLPSGGTLIDSPGVWEFGIWHLSAAEIEAGFIEFSGHRDGCKFNDCRHLGEPGCGVQAAVDAGQISRTRYRAYQEIVETNRRGAG